MRINYFFLKTNKLTLNTQKSVFMVFHRARLKSFNPPILINGTQLQEVSSTKYLGLIIDNKLKWIDHIAPQMIQDLYVTNNAVHHYSTRQSNLWHVPLGVHTNNFRYKSILIWNKLSTLGISFDIPISRFKNITKDLLQHSVLNVGYF